MPAALILIVDAIVHRALMLGAYICFPPPLVSGSSPIVPPPSSDAAGGTRLKLLQAHARPALVAVR
jgi:hypothetical protein